MKFTILNPQSCLEWK